ncbi:hypothetical protein [Saccharopolyspora rosea]|uniref:Uncharacterized protein n=1 Tax=Saccharopolyspora rosea TaxID=524884 RepID=A0ABW3FLG6_9PSEU|nr:hypothetical protein [Saccharopolyspora rosea]
MSERNPASARYRELTDLANSAAERQRRAENERADELTKVVAAGQQRIKEADEARAQAVSDVRRSWHAAMEKLWHEKWMRVSGMPEPDLDAPPATPEESRRAVQEALLALVDSVSKQRGSLLPRRRKSSAVPDRDDDGA